MAHSTPQPSRNGKRHLFMDCVAVPSVPLSDMKFYKPLAQSNFMCTQTEVCPFVRDSVCQINKTLLSHTRRIHLPHLGSKIYGESTCVFLKIQEIQISVYTTLAQQTLLLKHSTTCLPKMEM
jgi:hypothetical protein